ncbi:hypothetical protein KC326_g190 [Hortaea werneckii]|nr:hypothetical protein KC326_g190 [Hortaea werneckii]
MPSLEADQSPDSALHRWRTVFKSAFLRRINAEALAVPLKQLYSEDTLSARAISDVLLGFQASKGAVDDPLLFHYAQHLLEASYISTGELLLTLLERSSFATKPAAGNEGEQISSGLPTCEERMFTLLAQLHLNGTLSLAAKDLHQAVYAIARWLRVVHERESNKQLNSDELLTLDTTTQPQLSLRSKAEVVETASVLGRPGNHSLECHRLLNVTPRDDQSSAGSRCLSLLLSCRLHRCGQACIYG